MLRGERSRGLSAQRRIRQQRVIKGASGKGIGGERRIATGALQRHGDRAIEQPGVEVGEAIVPG